MKADEFPIITTSQYQEEASNWLDAIRRGEDVSVIFFPKTDRSIRLGQLLNDADLIENNLGHRNKYIFQPINFDAHDVEDSNDFQFQLQGQLNHLKLTSKPLTFEEWISYLKEHETKLVLILPEAEQYLTMPGKISLTALTQVVENFSPLIRIISFFETNITHVSQIQYLPSASSLYENIYNYPLYNEQEAYSFIALIRDQWRVKISKKDENKIYSQCGGHFWLIKEMLRLQATGEKRTPDHESMQFRLRTIFSSLLPEDQDVMKKIALKNSDFTQDEQLELSYLKKMRVVGDNNRFIVGAFENFISKHYQPTVNLELRNHKVLVNQIEIGALFSRKELRVLTTLLENRGQLVGRDQLAKRIWITDESGVYSDWALDRLVARARQRLVQLALPRELIKVIRGRGYILKG